MIFSLNLLNICHLFQQENSDFLRKVDCKRKRHFYCEYFPTMIQLQSYVYPANNFYLSLLKTEKPECRCLLAFVKTKVVTIRSKDKVSCPACLSEDSN